MTIVGRVSPFAVSAAFSWLPGRAYVIDPPCTMDELRRTSFEGRCMLIQLRATMDDGRWMTIVARASCVVLRCLFVLVVVADTRQDLGDALKPCGDRKLS